jgi:hypothetical protein
VCTNMRCSRWTDAIVDSASFCFAYHRDCPRRSGANRAARCAICRKIPRTAPAPAVTSLRGTVNLLNLARTLAWSAARNARSRRDENSADFRPDREGAHPGFSILNGGDVIATEVKNIVDRFVGGQEPLRFAR